MIYGCPQRVVTERRVIDGWQYTITEAAKSKKGEAGGPDLVSYANFSAGDVQCPYCPHVAKKLSCLRAHVECDHLGHACPDCNFTTVVFPDLIKHQRTVHKNILNVRQYWVDKKVLKVRATHRPKNDPRWCICNDCYEKCIIGGPKPKGRPRPPKPKEIRKCDKCTHVVRTKTLLNCHVKAVHDQIKDNKCQFCDYATSSKWNLKVHMNTHYHKCPVCPYSAPHKSHLTEHMIKYHARYLKYRRESLPQEGINMKEHDYAVPDKCMGNPNLAEHIDKGSDKKESTEMSKRKKEYKCDQCSYNAKENEGDLKRHVRAVHDKIKDHKCPYCSFETSWEKHLRKHVKSTHVKIQDHKCPSCDYATSNRNNLNRHFKNRHKEAEPIKVEEKREPKKIKISDCRSMAEGTHPPFIDMVKEAIKATHPKVGTSRQAIIKYIGANYNVGDKLSKQVNDALSIGVVMGDLVRTKGQGASGSFIVATKAAIQCELCKMVCKNEIHLANHVKVMHMKNLAKKSPSPKLPTHKAVPHNMAAFVEKSVAKSSPPAEPERPTSTSSAAVPSNHVPCQFCGCFCDDKIHLANHVKAAHKSLFASEESVTAFVEKSVAKFCPPSSDAAIPSNNNVESGNPRPNLSTWIYFKPDQLRIMKAFFQNKQYLNNKEATKLAQETNLDRKILYRWFKKERRKKAWAERRKKARDKQRRTQYYMGQPVTEETNQGKESSGVTIPSNNNDEESGRPCDKLCIKQEVVEDEEEEEGELVIDTREESEIDPSLYEVKIEVDPLFVE